MSFRADSLREYLTGAGSDGGAQSDPAASLGNFRSSTESVSLGISVANALSGVSILFASGSSPIGTGILVALNTTDLSWSPFGVSDLGPSVTFVGTADEEIVEAAGHAEQYLRIEGTPPFTPGQSQITLDYLTGNLLSFGDITIAQAAAGMNKYRAVMVRNESVHSITGFQRWLDLLGTPQPANVAQLGASGSGTVTTTGDFSDWPAYGWCQVRQANGTLIEEIYYSSRTDTTLTVPSTGRGLLGTSATAGGSSDIVYPTPGIALAVDDAGIQAFGSSIQTIANETTAPTGVTWNHGITAATGLQIGTLGVAEEVGVWMWRQIPAGAKATPLALIKVLDGFHAF